MTRGSIPAERYAERVARTQELVREHGVGGLLVGVGADLRWLIGYAAMPLERLTMLVVPAEGRAVLVAPRLEAEAARASVGVGDGVVELVTWQETEDPIDLVARQDGIEAASGAGRPLLVSDWLGASFLLRLQGRLPGASWDVSSRLITELRAVKDGDEIQLLRRAAHAADRVVTAIAAGRLIGRSEADVAREVRERLQDEGHDEPAFWIVASGPNSASPHHDATDREIGTGEPIVLDIGGRLEGYGSDITRTLWVTGPDGLGPDDTFRGLFEVLRRAQAAASDAAMVGTSGEAVDETARAIIREAGLGEHFIHRTGHGIGLEGHEEPYLVSGNREPLRPGNAFSVEPGIYLEGRYGARVEDIVVATESGPDVLNQVPRELAVVAGI